jgi:hypothetical protein
MNLQKISGILITSGFTLFVVGALLSPPGLYQESDIAVRVAVVNANQSSWIASQVVSGVSMVVFAVGFLYLSLHLKGKHPRWMLKVAASAMLVGAVSGVIYLFQYTPDPASVWNSVRAIPSIIAAMLFTVLGSLLYGLVFLRGDTPSWLGYLMLGAAAVSTGIFVAGGGAVAFFAIAIVYIAALIAGIVLLRQ